MDLIEEIRSHEQRLYAAMRSSDVAELDLLIADELLFVGPTGALAIKEQDLDFHRARAIRFHEFTPLDLQIRVHAGFALAFAKIHLAGDFLGQAFAGDFLYTRVWALRDAGWQIVGGSVTPVVGP